MDIFITGRHVEISEELRAHIRERAGRFSRFYDRIHDIEVVFNNESEQFTAELVVRVDRKNTFVASDIGPDATILVDRICEKMQRQLSKHKEKLRTRKGGVAADKLPDDLRKPGARRSKSRD